MCDGLVWFDCPNTYSSVITLQLGRVGLGQQTSKGWHFILAIS
jgi:hypothetical protein